MTAPSRRKFSPVKEDRYAAARRAIPLPELWKQYGKPCSVKGSRFETPFTPCCGTATRKDAGSLFLNSNGEWRWHCFRCSRGGSAVDLVASEEGISPDEAVKKLLGDAGGFQAVMGRDPIAAAPRVTQSEKDDAARELIQGILAREQNRVCGKEIFTYLTQERGISKEVLAEAVQRDLLRFLPSNVDAAMLALTLPFEDSLLRKAGLLKAKQKRPAAAYRPIVFISTRGTTMEFTTATLERKEGMPKALQYGGGKTLPMVWTPSGKVEKILVVEGGIDLLSCVTLGLAHNTMIVGLMGAGAWREDWVKSLACRNPNALWQIGFDKDKAGDSSGGRLTELLGSLGAACETLPPWGGGNDWNDTLLAARSF